MAYATVAHVEARNPERAPYTANTKPSATQVVGFINEAAGIIDLTLTSEGYSAPVDVTSTLVASSIKVMLQDANAAGAAYKVEWAAAVSDRRTEYEDMWESALKMIRTADLDLAQDTSESNPRGGFAGATPALFSIDMEL